MPVSQYDHPKVLCLEKQYVPLMHFYLIVFFGFGCICTFLIFFMHFWFLLLKWVSVGIHRELVLLLLSLLDILNTVILQRATVMNLIIYQLTHDQVASTWWWPWITLLLPAKDFYHCWVAKDTILLPKWPQINTTFGSYGHAQKEKEYYLDIEVNKFHDMYFTMFSFLSLSFLYALTETWKIIPRLLLHLNHS